MFQNGADLTELPVDKWFFEGHRCCSRHRHSGRSRSRLRACWQSKALGNCKCEKGSDE